MRHELKTDRSPFNDVWQGRKLYEIRKDDRTRDAVPHEALGMPGMGFEVGDELVLRETEYSGVEMQRTPTVAPLKYTGRELLCVVKHKLTGYGLQTGWCILGIDVTGKADHGPNTMDYVGDRIWTLPCFWKEPEKDEPVRHEAVKTRDPQYRGVTRMISEYPPRAAGWSIAEPPKHWIQQYGRASALQRMHSTHPLFCMGTNCFSDGVTPHSEECLAEQMGTFKSARRASELHAPAPARAFSHYFRPCPYDGIDVYRTLEIFGVTNPAIQHAIKKLLVPGRRGAKDVRKDLSEAVVSINRAIEMMDEDARGKPA